MGYWQSHLVFFSAQLCSYLNILLQTRGNSSQRKILLVEKYGLSAEGCEGHPLFCVKEGLQQINHCETQFGIWMENFRSKFTCRLVRKHLSKKKSAPTRWQFNKCHHRSPPELKTGEKMFAETMGTKIKKKKITFFKKIGLHVLPDLTCLFLCCSAGKNCVTVSCVTIPPIRCRYARAAERCH